MDDIHEVMNIESREMSQNMQENIIKDGESQINTSHTNSNVEMTEQNPNNSSKIDKNSHILLSTNSDIPISLDRKAEISSEKSSHITPILPEKQSNESIQILEETLKSPVESPPEILQSSPQNITSPHNKQPTQFETSTTKHQLELKPPQNTAISPGKQPTQFVEETAKMLQLDPNSPQNTTISPEKQTTQFVEETATTLQLNPNSPHSPEKQPTIPTESSASKIAENLPSLRDHLKQKQPLKQKISEEIPNTEEIQKTSPPQTQTDPNLSSLRDHLKHKQPMKQKLSEEIQKSSPPQIDANLPPLSDELKQGQRILKELMSSNKSVIWPFLDAVDEATLGISDYYSTISHPMWLRKMKDKFDNREYQSIVDFTTDFRLMIENCFRYNGPDHGISRRAQRLETMLEQKLALLSRELRMKTSVCSTTDDTNDLYGALFRRRNRSIIPHDSTDFLNQLRWEETQRDRESRRLQTIEKRAQVEAQAQEVVEWDKEMMKGSHFENMWQVPQISLLLYLCQDALNLRSVIHYEIERCFAMSRESSTIADIMTSLLSTPSQRSTLDKKPSMPYTVWEEKLRQRLTNWYRMLAESGNNIHKVSKKLGLEPSFFKVVGLKNPLEKRRYHELSYYRKVCIMKGLCDYSVPDVDSSEDDDDATTDYSVSSTPRAVTPSTNHSRATTPDQNYDNSPNKPDNHDLSDTKNGATKNRSREVTPESDYLWIPRRQTRSSARKNDSTLSKEILTRNFTNQIRAQKRHLFDNYDDSHNTKPHSGENTTNRTRSDGDVIDKIVKTDNEQMLKHSQISDAFTNLIEKAQSDADNDSIQSDFSYREKLDDTFDDESVENDYCRDNIREDDNRRDNDNNRDSDNSIDYNSKYIDNGRENCNISDNNINNIRDNLEIIENDNSRDADNCKDNDNIRDDDNRIDYNSKNIDNSRDNYNRIDNNSRGSSIHSAAFESDAEDSENTVDFSSNKFDVSDVEQSSVHAYVDLTEKSPHRDTNCDRSLNDCDNSSDGFENLEDVHSEISSEIILRKNSDNFDSFGQTEIFQHPVESQNFNTESHFENGDCIRYNLENVQQNQQNNYENDDDIQTLDHSQQNSYETIGVQPYTQNSDMECGNIQIDSDSLTRENNQKTFTNLDDAIHKHINDRGDNISQYIDDQQSNSVIESSENKNDNIADQDTDKMNLDIKCDVANLLEDIKTQIATKLDYPKHLNNDLKFNKEITNEPESESEDELIPDASEFELVAETVENLRDLVAQFAEPECTRTKRSRGKNANRRRRCVVELHERLEYLLKELEPWENKLIQATKRARQKLRREFDSYVEEEEENQWESDNESTTKSHNSDTESGTEETELKTETESEMFKKAAAIKTEQEFYDTSVKCRLRKRKYIEGEFSNRRRQKIAKSDMKNNLTDKKHVPNILKHNKNIAVSQNNPTQSSTASGILFDGSSGHHPIMQKLLTVPHGRLNQRRSIKRDLTPISLKPAPPPISQSPQISPEAMSNIITNLPKNILEQLMIHGAVKLQTFVSGSTTPSTFILTTNTIKNPQTPPNILPHATAIQPGIAIQPGTVLKPQTVFQPVLKPASIIQPGSILHPVGQSGSILQPVPQAGTILQSVPQSGRILQPVRQPGTVLQPIPQPGSILQPISQSGTILQRIAQPVGQQGTVLQPTAQPGSILQPVGQSGPILQPIRQPGTVLQPLTLQPGTILQSQNLLQPGNILQPTPGNLKINFPVNPPQTVLQPTSTKSTNIIKPMVNLPDVTQNIVTNPQQILITNLTNSTLPIGTTNVIGTQNVIPHQLMKNIIVPESVAISQQKHTQNTTQKLLIQPQIISQNTHPESKILVPFKIENPAIKIGHPGIKIENPIKIENQTIKIANPNKQIVVPNVKIENTPNQTYQHSQSQIIQQLNSVPIQTLKTPQRNPPNVSNISNQILQSTNTLNLPNIPNLHQQFLIPMSNPMPNIVTQLNLNSPMGPLVLSSSQPSDIKIAVQLKNTKTNNQSEIRQFPTLQNQLSSTSQVFTTTVSSTNQVKHETTSANQLVDASVTLSTANQIIDTKPTTNELTCNLTATNDLPRNIPATNQFTRNITATNQLSCNISSNDLTCNIPSTTDQKPDISTTNPQTHIITSSTNQLSENITTSTTDQKPTISQINQITSISGILPSLPTNIETKNLGMPPSGIPGLIQLATSSQKPKYCPMMTVKNLLEERARIIQNIPEIPVTTDIDNPSPTVLKDQVCAQINDIVSQIKNVGNEPVTQKAHVLPTNTVNTAKSTPQPNVLYMLNRDVPSLTNKMGYSIQSPNSTQNILSPVKTTHIVQNSVKISNEENLPKTTLLLESVHKTDENSPIKTENLYNNTSTSVPTCDGNLQTIQDNVDKLPVKLEPTSETMEKYPANLVEKHGNIPTDGYQMKTEISEDKMEAAAALTLLQQQDPQSQKIIHHEPIKTEKSDKERENSASTKTMIPLTKNDIAAIQSQHPLQTFITPQGLCKGYLTSQGIILLQNSVKNSTVVQSSMNQTKLSAPPMTNHGCILSPSTAATINSGKFHNVSHQTKTVYTYGKNPQSQISGSGNVTPTAAKLGQSASVVGDQLPVNPTGTTTLLNQQQHIQLQNLQQLQNNAELMKILAENQQKLNQQLQHLTPKLSTQIKPEISPNPVGQNVIYSPMLANPRVIAPMAFSLMNQNIVSPTIISNTNVQNTSLNMNSVLQSPNKQLIVYNIGGKLVTADGRQVIMSNTNSTSSQVTPPNTLSVPSSSAYFFLDQTPVTLNSFVKQEPSSVIPAMANFGQTKQNLGNYRTSPVTIPAEQLKSNKQDLVFKFENQQLTKSGNVNPALNSGTKILNDGMRQITSKTSSVSLNESNILKNVTSRTQISELSTLKQIQTNEIKTETLLNESPIKREISTQNLKNLSSVIPSQTNQSASPPSNTNAQKPPALQFTRPPITLQNQCIKYVMRTVISPQSMQQLKMSTSQKDSQSPVVTVTEYSFPGLLKHHIITTNATIGGYQTFARQNITQTVPSSTNKSAMRLGNQNTPNLTNQLVQNTIQTLANVPSSTNKSATRVHTQNTPNLTNQVFQNRIQTSANVKQQNISTPHQLQLHQNVEQNKKILNLNNIDQPVYLTSKIIPPSAKNDLSKPTQVHTSKGGDIITRGVDKTPHGAPPPDVVLGKTLQNNLPNTSVTKTTSVLKSPQLSSGFSFQNLSNSRIQNPTQSTIQLKNSSQPHTLSTLQLTTHPTKIINNSHIQNPPQSQHVSTLQLTTHPTKIINTNPHSQVGLQNSTNILHSHQLSHTSIQNPNPNQLSSQMPVSQITSPIQLQNIRILNPVHIQNSTLQNSTLQNSTLPNSTQIIHSTLQNSTQIINSNQSPKPHLLFQSGASGSQFILPQGSLIQTNKGQMLLAAVPQTEPTKQTQLDSAN